MAVVFHEKFHFFHWLQWDTQVKPVNDKVSVCEAVLEQVYALCRGALMHGLQGAEAQGPTLERGPTGCREIPVYCKRNAH